MSLAPKYPFDRMKVGQCFTVPASQSLRVRDAAAYYSKKTGKVFRALRVRNEPLTVYRLRDDGSEPEWFAAIKWTVY